jgi:hypothetical protein
MSSGVTRMAIDPEYVELIRRVSGTSARFVEALEPEDSLSKLRKLEEVYNAIAAEACRQRAAFLLLLEQEPTPESVQQKQQIEDSLKSLQLESYRVSREIMALYLRCRLASDASLLEHQVVKDVSSALAGEIDPVDLVQTIK